MDTVPVINGQNGLKSVENENNQKINDLYKKVNLLLQNQEEQKQIATEDENVNADKKYTRKAIRLLFFMACTAAYLYFAVNAVIRFISYPASTNYDTIFVSDTEFPAVTLCHYNTVKRSYLQQKLDEGIFIHGLYYNNEYYLPFVKFMQEKGEFTQLDLLGGSNNTLTDMAIYCNIINTGLYQNLSQELQDPRYNTLEVNDELIISYARYKISQGWLFVNYSQNMEIMKSEYMEWCLTEDERESINGRYVDVAKNEHDWEKIFREGGYTIDDIRANNNPCGASLIRDSLFYNMTCEVNSRVVNSYFGLCHTMVFKDQNGDLLKAYSDNKYDILELYLYQQPEEYSVFVYDLMAPSFLLKFHNPNEFVNMDRNVLFLQTGASYATRIKKRVVASLGEPYSETPCYKTEAENYKNPLKYFDKYSYDACKEECINNEVIRMCGCKSIGFPAKNISTCSTVDEIRCEAMVLDIRNECTMCLQPCHKVQFETQVDKQGNLAYNYNFRITMAYDSFEVVKVTQNVAYPPASLFGDLGGQLGLFVGASVMTVIEIAEWFFADFVKKIMRRNQMK